MKRQIHALRIATVLFSLCAGTAQATEFAKYSVTAKSHYNGQQKPASSGYRCRLAGVFEHPWFVLDQDLIPANKPKSQTFFSQSRQNRVWDERELKFEVSQLLNRKDTGHSFGKEAVNDNFSVAIVDRCEEDTTTTETYTYSCGEKNSQTCTGTRIVTNTDYTYALWDCPVEHERLAQQGVIDSQCVFSKMLRRESSSVVAAIQARETTIQIRHLEKGNAYAFSNCTGNETEKFMMTIEGGLRQRSPREDDFVLKVTVNGESFKLKSDNGVFYDEVLLCPKDSTSFKVEIAGREKDIIKDDIYEAAGEGPTLPLSRTSSEIDMQRTFFKFWKWNKSMILVSVRPL